MAPLGVLRRGRKRQVDAAGVPSLSERSAWGPEGLERHSSVSCFSRRDPTTRRSRRLGNEKPRNAGLFFMATRDGDAPVRQRALGTAAAARDRRVSMSTRDHACATDPTSWVTDSYRVHASSRLRYFNGSHFEQNIHGPMRVWRRPVQGPRAANRSGAMSLRRMPKDQWHRPYDRGHVSLGRFNAERRARSIQIYVQQRFGGYKRLLLELW